MNFRLTTVRRKLTALVAFSGIVTLAALPVLSWIMDRQIVEQVNERVPAAVHGFELELADDLRNLSTIAEQLESQSDVTAALRSHNAQAIRSLWPIFHLS